MGYQTGGGAGGLAARMNLLELNLADMQAMVVAHDEELTAARADQPSLGARLLHNEQAIATLQSIGDPFHFDGPNPPIKGIGLWVPDGSGQKVLVPFPIVFNDSAINHAALNAFIANTASYSSLQFSSGTNRGNGTQGVAYSDTLHITGGTPYATGLFSEVGSNLPSGVTVHADGTVSGTIAGGATTGTYTYVARYTDVLGAYVDKTFTFTVTASGAAFAVNVPDPVPVDAMVGVAGYTYALGRFATNAGGAVTWAGTSVPAGWAVAADGTISTTTAPTSNGVVTISGTANDTHGPISWTTHIIVDAAVTGPTITSLDLGVATQNQPFAALLLNDGGGTAPYTWSRTSGSAIPTGLTFVTGTTLHNGWAATGGVADLTLAAHGLQVNQPVFLGTNSMGGTMPGFGVVFVKSKTTNTVQLAATLGGAALVPTNSSASFDLATVPCLYGVPTTLLANGSSIIFRCTDSTITPGNLYDEKTVQLSVVTGAAFTWTPPSTVTPDPQVGVDFAGFDLDAYTAGATGTKTWGDWDPAGDITAVTATASTDTLHGTGLGSLAAGTGVRLEGTAGAGGLADYKTQLYFIVNPNAGADTAQLALTTGGAAVNVTADLSGLTVHRSTLPSHKMRFDYDGSITGHAGRIYTTAGDPPTAAATFTSKFTVKDAGGTGTVITHAVTITIDPASSAQVDLNTYGGFTWGDTPSDSQVLTNVTTFNTAHTAAVSAGATIVCNRSGATTTTPVVLRIGVDKSGHSATQILKSGGTTVGGATGHNDWDIANVEIKVHDSQPLFDDSSGGNIPCMLWIGNVTTGFKHLNLRMNSNGAHQSGINVKRGGGVANRWGWYAHMLNTYNCGPIPAGANLTFLNSCGVTGSTGSTNMSSTTVSAAGTSTNSMSVADKAKLPDASAGNPIPATVTWTVGSTNHSLDVNIVANSGSGAGTITLDANYTWGTGATISYFQWALEVFHWENRIGYGGDGALGTGPAGVTGFDLTVTDNDARGNPKPGLRASGFVSHFTHDSTSSPAPMSYIRTATIFGSRHGFGTYCGGSWTVLAWTYDSTQHGGNHEDGDPTASTLGPTGTRQTQHVEYGVLGVSGVQGVTQNCTQAVTGSSTACGIQHNGNGTADGSCTIIIRGHHSITDDTALRVDNRPPASVTIDQQQVDTPVKSIVTASGSTAQKAASLAAIAVTTSHVHSLGGASKVIGGAAVGSGDWTSN